MDDVQAEVTAEIDPKGGSEGNEHIPVYPYDIAYEVYLVSSATTDELERVTAAVEAFCPILNLLRRGNEIKGRSFIANRARMLRSPKRRPATWGSGLGQPCER